MKRTQVNVLMDEQLLQHLEKLSATMSILKNKKITVSDIVRKSIVGYTQYGDTVIECKEPQGDKIEMYIKSLSKKESGLIKKLFDEEW